MMRVFSPLALLLFGIALGACLPVFIGTLRGMLRQLWFKPTLLRLDRVLPSASMHEVDAAEVSAAAPTGVSAAAPARLDTE